MKKETICHLVVMFICILMSYFAIKYVIDRWKKNVTNNSGNSDWQKQDKWVNIVIVIIVVYVLIFICCVYCLVKAAIAAKAAKGLLQLERVGLSTRDNYL